METDASIADAIRKTSEAYVQGLLAVMKAVESLPRETGDAHRRLVEQWLGLARTSKDGFVAAVTQAFDLWERECRRAVGAPHPAGAPGAWGNPLEAWAEGWRRTLDTLSAAGPLGDAPREAIRRQVEMARQVLDEGMRAWQALWQPAGRK